MPNKYSHSNVVSQYSSLGLIERPEKSQIPTLEKKVAFASDQPNALSKSSSAHSRRHSTAEMTARPVSDEVNHPRRRSQDTAQDSHTRSAAYYARGEEDIGQDLATSYQRAASKRPFPFVKSHVKSPNLDDHEYVLQIGPSHRKIESAPPLYYDLTEPRTVGSQNLLDDDMRTLSSLNSSQTSLNQRSTLSSHTTRDSGSKMSTDSTRSSNSTKSTPLSMIGDALSSLDAAGFEGTSFQKGKETLSEVEDIAEETVPVSQRIQARIDRTRLRALSPVIEHPLPPSLRRGDSELSDAEVSRVLRSTRTLRGLLDPSDVSWKDEMEVVEGIEVTSRNIDGTRIPEQEAKEINALSPDDIAPRSVPRRPASPPPPAGYEETKYIGARTVDHNEPEMVSSNRVVGKGHLPETAVLAAENRTPRKISTTIGQPHIEAVMPDGRTQRLA